MNKKLLIITSVICALPLVFAVIVYGQLPDTLAIHWDMAGNANGWMPKPYAVFGLPLFLLIIHIVAVTATTHDPKRQNQAGVMRTAIYWIVPVISVIVNTMTLLIGMGHQINIGNFVMLFIGVLFILIGNYLPKSRQNYTIGIKLPWTLASADNWNKTHRLGGILFMIAGVVLLITPFVPAGTVQTVLTIGIIAIATIVPMIYSFLLYLKESK